MARTSPFHLDAFFDGYLNQLRTEAKFFSNPIDQGFEKGRLNETHLATLLRRYLPSRFGIGTGFVGSPHAKSHQSDIILFDALNNAPLYTSEAFAIYPLEMVYGVIEVKTNAASKLKKKGEIGLDDCFRKCAQLRSMAQSDLNTDEVETYKAKQENASWSADDLDRFVSFDEKRQKYVRPGKGYVRYIANGRRLEYYEKLSPRFFIFSYGGWKTASDFYDDFATRTIAHENAHVHGMCALTPTGSFYTRHIPHAEDKAKVLPVVEAQGFQEWLYSLPEILHTMLPPHQTAFDMVNLRRYRVQKEAPAAEPNLREQDDEDGSGC